MNFKHMVVLLLLIADMMYCNVGADKINHACKKIDQAGSHYQKKFFGTPEGKKLLAVEMELQDCFQATGSSQEKPNRRCKALMTQSASLKEKASSNPDVVMAKFLNEVKDEIMSGRDDMLKENEELSVIIAQNVHRDAKIQKT